MIEQLTKAHLLVLSQLLIQQFGDGNAFGFPKKNVVKLANVSLYASLVCHRMPQSASTESNTHLLKLIEEIQVFHAGTKAISSNAEDCFWACLLMVSKSSSTFD